MDASTIAEAAPDVPLWCGEALMPAPFIYPDRKGAWGCGIVMANATLTEMETCEHLWHALAGIGKTNVLKDNTPSFLSFRCWG